MRSLSIFLAALTLMSWVTASESQERPGYADPRYDEDWSFFETPKDDTRDRYDPIKNIHVTDELRLTLGGSGRVRLEDWRNFGFARDNDDAFVLYRGFVHSDWRYGDHLRVFLEAKHAASTDRDLPGGKRTALDVDDVDLWNGFLEVRAPVGAVEIMGRAGRQELKFGKQRLVSPLDWANNRRIFDGVRAGAYASDGTWKLDAFWTRPVAIDRDDLNEADDERVFAGLYFSKKSLGPIGLDAYFLYLENDRISQELYTTGVRVFGTTSYGLSFDIEAAYQFGETGNRDNSAWMAGIDLSYPLAEGGWKPWIGAGADYASGDNHPNDSDLETFNQLFPLGHAYLGYIDAVGRQNIIGIHGSFGATAPLSKPIKFKADLHHFWLADDDDALYNAGSGVVRNGGINERDVGFELDLTAAMQLTRHTNWSAGYSAFFPGDFIDKTGTDATIHFVYTQFKYIF